MGRDLLYMARLNSFAMFQSTRPVWGATRDRQSVGHKQLVSIHAPRVGRDDRERMFPEPEDVSIHAPRVGRDGGKVIFVELKQEFQSTRPVWGATGCSDAASCSP